MTTALKSIVAAVSMITLVPQAAHALTTGECRPATEVRAILAAEKQDPIILGNRTGYGYKTVLIFTSSADGSRGYLLRGDRPVGEQADTICVESVYRDVRLNDVTRSGVPEWALINSSPAVAAAQCKREKLGYQELCGDHTAALASMTARHQRVLLVVTGTAINPRDQSVRSDQKIIVAIDAAHSEGSIMGVTPQGANYALAAYTSMSLTQHAQALTDRR